MHHLAHLIVAAWLALAGVFPFLAGDIKNKYGSNNQAITVTLASLTNNSLRQATAIDNTSNVFQDALVFVNIKTGASSTSSTGFVNIWVAGSADGGTNYTDGATGTDGSFTATQPTNLKLLGQINCVANATTYKGGPFSVAAAFGGTLPDHWTIVVENKTGGTLDSTEGNHLKIYQGVYSQYT